MQTYISILRGINVSGQKKINMAELKALYETLNFKNVRTYIQSGNVIFEYKQIDPQKLSKQIEQIIAQKYHFEVSVIIRLVNEIGHVLNINPFLTKNDIDVSKLHVSFLSETPKQIDIDKIKILDYKPDEFIIIGKEVYVHCPNGYGNTKLTNTFFEKKLNLTATTRNWKTVNEIHKIMKPITGVKYS